MERKLMEFIIKNAGKEKETMHFVMYGGFSTKSSIYTGINEPEFKDVVIKKVIDGKETDFESKATTFSGYRLSSVDCANQSFASIVGNESNTEVIYLDPEVKALVNQYTEKTVCESEGRKISEYYYSSYFGVCKLYFATDQFLYYGSGEYEESVVLSTEDGRIVADIYDFVEMSFLESCENVENGEEKLLYGEMPK